MDSQQVILMLNSYLGINTSKTANSEKKARAGKIAPV